MSPVDRDLRILLCSLQLRPQRIALGDKLIELRTCDQLARCQLLIARSIGFGLLELRLHAADLAARSSDLRSSQLPLRIRIDRIECGHHVARIDVLAFLDKYFFDFAGDLR